jgi:hypothetical protein
MRLYPPPSPDLKGVAVRLDASPMERATRTSTN